MAQTRLRNAVQLELSSSARSIFITDGSSIPSYFPPTTGANHLLMWNDSATAWASATLGTNLFFTGTTLNASAGAGGYSEIQEEGSTVSASNTKINFVGAGLTAADAGAGVTSVTVDATLNALALYNTNGLLTQTSSDTFVGRTITGTASRISVTNGGGLSGNPTIDIDAAYVGQTSITTLGTITTGTWSATTIAANRGGTGQTTYAIGDLLYADSTSTLNRRAAVASGSVLKSAGVSTAPVWGTIAASDLTDGANIAHINATETIVSIWTFNTLPESSVAPTTSNQFTNKIYVDSLFQGVRDYKESVRLASTANVSVTYSATGGTSARGQITNAPNTLNGSTLVANNRILLKDQSTAAQNGIWIVTTVGTGANGVWDRATDFDADVEVTSGATLYVSEFTTTDNRGTYVLTTSDPIVIGGGSGTSLTFTQVDSPTGYVAGNGLTLSGLTFNVGTASASRIVVNADNIDLATTAVTPASYGSATQVGTFTVDTYGRLTAASNTTISVTSTAISDFTEAVQDVVGNASFLLEGSGIDITYNDGANTLTIAAANLYNSDGTIPNSVARTVTLGNSATVLTFQDSTTAVLFEIAPDAIYMMEGAMSVELDGITMTTTGGSIVLDSTGLQISTSSADADSYTFIDARAVSRGLEYAADYSADFTNRTLVDKQYVTNAIAAVTVTVTQAYLTGSTATTVDLDTGTSVTDVDGTNVAFTLPTDLKKFFVYRNGIRLSKSGASSPTRDYSVNTGTNEITFVTALTTGESVVFEKIA